MLSDKEKQKIKKGFEKYCKIRDFFVSPYEQDKIADFWLSILDEEKAELVKYLKEQEKEVIFLEMAKKYPDFINWEYNNKFEADVDNMNFGYNQAIQSVIEHLEK